MGALEIGQIHLEGRSCVESQGQRTFGTEKKDMRWLVEQCNGLMRRAALSADTTRPHVLWRHDTHAFIFIIVPPWPLRNKSARPAMRVVILYMHIL
jgi:hypothetical protein